MTENITTKAEVTNNSNITASETVSVLAQDEHQVGGKATGYSFSGVAAGGQTNITTTITNNTTAKVDNSAITAKHTLWYPSQRLQRIPQRQHLRGA